MKNIIKYIFPVAIFMLGFSCDNNETVKTEITTDDKCGDNSAKFIRNWCSSNGALIDLLSDKSMGEDWMGYGKTYHHTVLAVLDSTLSKANEDWSKVMNPSDSVFYFNYVSVQYEYLCKMCCPPTQTIIITSLASRPCPITSGN